MGFLTSISTLPTWVRQFRGAHLVYASAFEAAGGTLTAGSHHGQLRETIRGFNFGIK